MRAALVVCALAAACRYDLDDVPPPGGGDGDASVASAVRVHSMSPAIAGVGDTVVLEGDFADGILILFPGETGPVQPAVDILGLHRIAIDVPADARSGPLELRTASGTERGPTIRVASFAPRLGDFVVTPHQLDVARQAVSLPTPRRGAAAVVAGDWLYALGGVTGDGTWLDDVARAPIAADGAIGRFESVGALTAPRAFAAAVRVGDRLYLVGGAGPEPVATVERAAIAAGGLGPFEAVASSLRQPRAAHAAVVIGDAVFAFGGDGGDGVVATVERAPITADGLGDFAVVDGTALATARGSFTTALTRSSLYVAGGAGTDAIPRDDVEGAVVSGDGSVGDFGVDAVVDLKERAGHAALLAGHHAYVIGGEADTSVQEATVAADGRLGDFLAQPPALRVERRDHGFAIGRDHAYVVGGRAAADLATVEAAPLARGAGLGAFAAAGALTAARAGAAYVASGSRLCALGGASASGVLATVECAAAADDGSLGRFEVVASRLVTGRAGAAVAVIGRWLYIIGGDDGRDALRTIERAEIGADGSLGPFAAVATQLNIRRAGGRALILDQKLYVIGGWNGSSLEDSFEVATIASGDALSAFAVIDQAVPAVQGPVIGAIGSWVYLIGPGENRRASRSGDAFGDFGGAGGTSIGVDTAAAAAGDSVYVLGGAGAHAGTVYAGRLSEAGLGMLTEVGTLVTPRSAAGAIALGQWLYVLGGRDAATAAPLAAVERARLE